MYVHFKVLKLSNSMIRSSRISTYKFCSNLNLKGRSISFALSNFLKDPFIKEEELYLNVTIGSHHVTLTLNHFGIAQSP